MKPTSRILLIPLCVAVLGAGGLACSSDKKDSATATPTRPAIAAASPAPAAINTTVPAAVAAATATVAPAPPANTPVPPPPPPANTPVPPPPPQPTPPPAPPAPPAALAVNVSIIDFGFTPNAISARVGQPVTITARNTGNAPHTFSITGGGSTGTLNAGGSGTVQVTPTQAGTLTFFCMVHGQARMSGTITVTN
jgi:plastocyanin